MRSERRFLDLSHPIESGMPTYPGLPAPRVEPLLSHAASRDSYAGHAEFTITRVSMVGNTGTYLDSPWHRHAHASDLAGLPLTAVAGLEGSCLDASLSDGRAVVVVGSRAKLAGRAILIRTGWDRQWGTSAYWRPGPYLGESVIDQLIEAGAALVGVDFWNVDDPTDPRRPAHTRLLGAGIPIVEHLRGLDALPLDGFRFTAAAPAIRGAASFPVRAFAEIG